MKKLTLFLLLFASVVAYAQDEYVEEEVREEIEERDEERDRDRDRGGRGRFGREDRGREGRRGGPPGPRTGYRLLVDNLSSRTSWQVIKTLISNYN